MTIRDRDLAANNNDGGYPGLGMKSAKNLIDADPDGQAAPSGAIRFTFPDGPTQSQVWTPDLSGKLIVFDVQIIKTDGAGGGGDTVQLLNGANPITEAVSLNAVKNSVLGPLTLDLAQAVVSADKPLTVTRTKASQANAACVVVLEVARSA